MLDEPTTGTVERVSEVRLGRLRPLLLLLGVAALAVAAKLGGLTDRVTLDGLRELVESAGPWGHAVYVVAFTLGTLVQLPSTVFVFAAILAWGPVVGGLVAFAGMIVSVSFVFALVRGLGGSPLDAIRVPWVRRLLDRLDERPFTTVFALRLVFWTSPPLSFGLSATSLPFRHYLAGTAAAMVPVTAALALLFEELISRLV